MTPIKPYSKKQLANMYGISDKTLASWLSPFIRKIGPYKGRMFTPKQIKTIFESIGEP